MTSSQLSAMPHALKIAFIGGGNMSQAIIGGLLSGGRTAQNCIVIDPNDAARAALAADGVVTSAAFDARVLESAIIVLAVKPQMMKEALAPLAGKLENQLIISIAAGIDIDTIGRWLNGYKLIVRTMPNTPALIHAGITGLYAPTNINDAQRAMAQDLLSSVGKTVWFENEDMLNAVTAVSGSGPAYVFYMIEALENAAIELGFSPQAARLFAQETFLGSAKLAAASQESPLALRMKVTSKRGTTERAIESFDAADLKSKFIGGVKAARDRSRELGLELGLEPTRDE